LHLIPLNGIIVVAYCYCCDEHKRMQEVNMLAEKVIKFRSDTHLSYTWINQGQEFMQPVHWDREITSNRRQEPLWIRQKTELFYSSLHMPCFCFFSTYLPSILLYFVVVNLYMKYVRFFFACIICFCSLN
jgi:hypothetical protein